MCRKAHTWMWKHKNKVKSKHSQEGHHTSHKSCCCCCCSVLALMFSVKDLKGKHPWENVWAEWTLLIFPHTHANTLNHFWNLALSGWCWGGKKTLCTPEIMLNWFHFGDYLTIMEFPFGWGLSDKNTVFEVKLRAQHCLLFRWQHLQLIKTTQRTSQREENPGTRTADVYTLMVVCLGKHTSRAGLTETSRLSPII